MWRFLCLMLAFVAPAQAAIHCDGFEVRMPVSNWLSVYAKNGASDEYVSVLLTGGSSTPAMSAGVPPFVAEFPTTPFAITGIEVRISALASNPGISISSVGILSEWQQSGGSLGTSLMSWSRSVTSPEFVVGGPGDLAAAEYTAAGGYGHIDTFADVSDGGPTSIGSRSIVAPSYWNATTSRSALGEPGFPYIRASDFVIVSFARSAGYTATLYIDAIDVRLHYEDASTTSMSGSGTMSATLLKAKSISSAMAGSGSCAAILNAERNIYSDMTGTGKITPVISRDDGSAVYRYLMPEMIGTGVVTLTQPIRYGTIQSDMAGTGAVTASISHGKNIMAPSRNGTLALRGSGTMAGSPKGKRPIATAMDGSGTVSGGPLAKRPIATAMAGSGTVSAAMIAKRAIASAMSGSGTMVETLQAGRLHPGVAMVGSGAMALALLTMRPIVAAMQGSGLLSADLTVNTRLAAPDGRTFIVPESEATFIAPDDFIAFEATE